MTADRCVIPGCAIPRRHGPDCGDRETCDGCLTGMATVGTQEAA